MIIESDSHACPACPDGYVWTREGPTGKTCPVCKGTAKLPVSQQDDDIIKPGLDAWRMPDVMRKRRKP